MQNTLIIKEFVDLVGGTLDDNLLINDGDKILVTTPPGCWGPMITPSIKSGHEVSKPINLSGAEVGDSIAIFIERISVKSNYASSGTGKRINGRYEQDPTVNAICPVCNIVNPATKLASAGENGVVCSICGNSIIPQTLSNGYTVTYDQGKTLGVSVPKNAADIIANKVLRGEEQPPEGSDQHLATILAKADISGLITRVKPMVGNIGCIPRKPVPSSRNGGDMYSSLIANKDFSEVEKDDLTDAHMDVNSVCEGSIVISPVKVSGGGIYIGDVHSIQGNGELAKHTIDVTAEVLVQVKLIKGLALGGPVIIPPENEIDYRFRPFTNSEYQHANLLSRQFNFSIEDKFYPVQFIGSGNDLNEAIENGIDRISTVTNLSREEIMNRATISGEVEIGRTSGLVYITIMLSKSILEKIKLLEFVETQYGD